MAQKKIERVEVFGVAMPLIGTFTSGGISKDATKCVVVRLTASDGTIGISSIEPSAGAKSPGHRPGARGRDPRAHRARDRRAGSDQHQPPDRDAGQAHADAARRRRPRWRWRASSSRARMQGVPLYTYLGGAAQDERAVQRLDRRCFRPRKRRRKRSGGSRRDSARRRSRSAAASKPITTASRPCATAVGSAMKLRIDANCQYDADTSLKLCRMVKKFDLQLFEQPAPQGRHRGTGARAPRRRHSRDGGRDRSAITRVSSRSSRPTRRTS